MRTRGERSPLEPGYRLDRYELLCPVASGGMASVWLARLLGKHGFEKLVAVKTILPQYDDDLRFQQMFLDEARIASAIEHVNVAEIVDLGEQNGILYLAMEWIDGDSISKLHRTLQRNGANIPIGIALRVLADTCGGLHAAHELRGKDGELLHVVHRDVSPQNILVSIKGSAKLIDFGIAKARDRISGDTSTGLLKGKIMYMAPEQAIGREIDRRADVWAIGAVLYHLLADVPPYEGANELATLHLLTSKEPPAPLPARVPGIVQEIVFRALEHDLEKRIPTALELQRQLEGAMTRLGLHATPQDVARFVETQLSERIESRRKAVQVALEAAGERARVQALVRSSPTDSSNGVYPNATITDAPHTPHLPSTTPPMHGIRAITPPPPSFQRAGYPNIPVESRDAREAPTTAEPGSYPKTPPPGTHPGVRSVPGGVPGETGVRSHAAYSQAPLAPPSHPAPPQVGVTTLGSGSIPSQLHQEPVSKITTNATLASAIVPYPPAGDGKRLVAVAASVFGVVVLLAGIGAAAVFATMKPAHPAAAAGGAVTAAAHVDDHPEASARAPEPPPSASASAEPEEIPSAIPSATALSKPPGTAGGAGAPTAVPHNVPATVPKPPQPPPHRPPPAASTKPSHVIGF